MDIRDEIPLDSPDSESGYISYLQEEYARMTEDAESARISTSRATSPQPSESGRTTPDTDTSFSNLTAERRQYFKKYRAAKSIGTFIKNQLQTLPNVIESEKSQIICMGLK